MSGKYDGIDWHARAGTLATHGAALINGARVGASSGETFAKRSPIDGRVLGNVAAGDSVDIDAAVVAARASFERGDWSRLAPAKRKRVLQDFAARVEAAAEELALLETLDMGKPISDSLAVDVPATARCLRWYGEAIDKIYGEVAPTAPDTLALITREPVGVVGAIVPWNFPMIMAAWKIAPVLAAGNSLVLKPSEKSPLHRAAARRAGARGRRSGGRVQRRAGFRSHGRQGPGAAHGCGRHRLHRFDGDRQADRAVRRAVEPEARVARVRRQESQHRHGRLPGPETRGARGGGGDLLQPGRDVFGRIAAARAGEHTRRHDRGDRGDRPQHAAGRPARCSDAARRAGR